MTEQPSDPVSKVTAAAKRLLALRDAKEALEVELKAVNAEKEVLEKETLPRLMTDHEIEKLTIEGVGTLFLQGSCYAYIRKDDERFAHQWLRDNGHAAILKESIHHSTLRSWVSEQMENGAELPPFFNAKPINIARIRRK